MIYYRRCSHCHYQEKGESDSIGSFQCPKCPSITFDLYSGSVPKWWIDEDAPPDTPVATAESTTTKRMIVTAADPFFIAGAIYASFEHNPWWLLVVPLVMASWFVNPRWTKATGWRFWHE